MRSDSFASSMIGRVIRLAKSHTRTPPQYDPRKAQIDQKLVCQSRALPDTLKRTPHHEERTVRKFSPHFNIIHRIVRICSPAEDIVVRLFKDRAGSVISPVQIPEKLEKELASVLRC